MHWYESEVGRNGLCATQLIETENPTAITGELKLETQTVQPQVKTRKPAPTQPKRGKPMRVLTAILSRVALVVTLNTGMGIVGESLHTNAL